MGWLDGSSALSDVDWGAGKPKRSKMAINSLLEVGVGCWLKAELGCMSGALVLLMGFFMWLLGFID